MANIGKMALILTANASSLASDLSMASAKVGGFAGDVKAKMATATVPRSLAVDVVGADKARSQIGALAATKVPPLTITPQMAKAVNVPAPKPVSVPVAATGIDTVASRISKLNQRVDLIVDASTSKAAVKVAQVTEKAKAASPASRASSPSPPSATEGGGLGIGGAVLAGAAGGAIVVGAKLAVKGLWNMIQMTQTLREDAARLGVVFSTDVLRGIDRSAGSIRLLKGEAMNWFGTFVAAAEPAISTFAAVFSEVGTAVRPIMSWLVDKVAISLAHGFQTVVGVAGVLIGQLGEMWSSWSQASGVADWFGQWPEWGQSAKIILHGLAIGFSYVWDTVKAGTGIVWTVLGNIGKMVSSLMDKFNALAKAINQNAKLKDVLGFEIPTFDDTVIKGLNRIGGATAKTGWQMVTDFGKTHAAIDEIFKDMEIKRLRAEMPLQYTAVGAALSGSKEAYSIEAKFRTQGMFDEQNRVARDQLMVQREIAKEARAINQAMGRGEKVGEL